MSKLTKRAYNNGRYPRPIPISIPLAHISNNYFTPYEVFESIYDTIAHIYNIGILRARTVDVVFDIYMDLSFKVTDPGDMQQIWNNGFFGKGVLSRSEPTWQSRMEKKINNLLTPKLDDDGFNEIKINDDIFSEDVTKQRRLLRDAWKREREAYFMLEKEIKLKSTNGEISTEDRYTLDLERERLSKLKDDLTKGSGGINPDLLLSRARSPNTLPSRWNDSNNSSSNNNNNSSKIFEEKLRIEDYDVLIDSKNIRNVEYLELDPCETLFLLQLGVIKVKVNNNYIQFKELVKLLVETFGPIIINEYVVYYHYRTLGWCVKNGLKFSCDWVLYSRGPPFSHAEFSIKVINENDTILSQEETLIDYSAVSRVVTGVKKSLVLCFVDGPELEGDEWFDMWNEYLHTGDFLVLLNRFTVNEITWKRWAPSRTRM